jgi:hypothetical protein
MRKVINAEAPSNKATPPYGGLGTCGALASWSGIGMGSLALNLPLQPFSASFLSVWLFVAALTASGMLMQAIYWCVVRPWRKDTPGIGGAEWQIAPFCIGLAVFFWFMRQ